jgi:hypothetical protein
MKIIRYLILPILIIALFFSACEKEGLTEDELLENLAKSSFSIQVADNETEYPLSGANVTIGVSGKVLKDTTDAAGMVYFENLSQQDNVKLIVEKDGYFSYNNLVDLSFSSRNTGEHVNVSLVSEDNAAIIRGVVSVQTDLTTVEAEHPSGIIIKALNTSKKLLASTTTNSNGEYELIIPVGSGISILMDFPTLQYDQTLKVRDTSNTVVSTTAKGTIFDPKGIAEMVPNTSNVIANVGQPSSTVSGGKYFTASVNSLTIEAGVITGLEFGYLGQGYTGAKNITITSLEGGSGADITCNGVYTGYYTEPYYAVNPASLNIISGGTGYPVYEPNENVYHISPSGFKWEGAYYYYPYYMNTYSRYFTKGEVYTLDVDYGTGTTRGYIPVEF